MTATEALIAELQEQCEYESRWSIRSDKLEEFYDSVELYRSAYQTEQISVDEYGPENAGELVVLVGQITERDYRNEFRDAGLYLTYDDRIELTGRFVRTIKNAVVLHTPEPETFRAMLRDFKRYDESVLVYQQTFFDTDRLASKCANEYAEIRFPNADSAAAQALVVTVSVYLKLLLQRHVVELEALAPALFDILRTVALHEGVLRTGRRAEEAHARGEGATPDVESGRAAALRVLGLSGEPSKRELQNAYRSLMRRYHPDVNPKGLETAKRINHAYGVLVTTVR